MVSKIVLLLLLMHPSVFEKIRGHCKGPPAQKGKLPHTAAQLPPWQRPCSLQRGCRSILPLVSPVCSHSLVLCKTEQRNAYLVIDDVVERAYPSAAANAGRVIYGASPGERKLRAWLRADDKIVIELSAMLEELKSVLSFKRRTGSIFNEKARVPTLPAR